jgi:hypothetical protein
MGVLLW